MAVFYIVRIVLAKDDREKNIQIESYGWGRSENQRFSSIG
jgi:hypothetical protein